MTTNCEKCEQFDESTLGHTLLGIPCDLCRSCFRSWARWYHKHPKTLRFEILSARMDLYRATTIGKPLVGDHPYSHLDTIVEEREAAELTLVENTIDWLEEKI